MSKLEIPQPINNIFTIYSISNCIYCEKIKELFILNNLEYNKIDCDEFVKNDEELKEKFLNFIEKNAGVKYKTFPIIFFGNEFIGGYDETNEYIKCKILKFDEEF